MAWEETSDTLETPDRMILKNRTQKNLMKKLKKEMKKTLKMNLVVRMEIKVYCTYFDGMKSNFDPYFVLLARYDIWNRISTYI